MKKVEISINCGKWEFTEYTSFEIAILAVKKLILNSKIAIVQLRQRNDGIIREWDNI